MPKVKKLPSHSYLKELFTYNKITGDLVWKIRPSKHFPTSTGAKLFNARFAGGIAGGVAKARHGAKYRVVGINGSIYKVHRIIWKFVNRNNPEFIDHIDGDSLNNSLSNLRDVSHGANQRNRRLQENNTSGVTGVYLDKKSNKWVAIIKSGRSNRYLGQFTTIDAARKARKQAEKDEGYSIHHGEIK